MILPNFRSVSKSKHLTFPPKFACRSWNNRLSVSGRIQCYLSAVARKGFLIKPPRSNWTLLSQVYRMNSRNLRIQNVADWQLNWVLWNKIPLRLWTNLHSNTRALFINLINWAKAWQNLVPRMLLLSLFPTYNCILPNTSFCKLIRWHNLIKLSKPLVASNIHSSLLQVMGLLRPWQVIPRRHLQFLMEFLSEPPCFHLDVNLIAKISKVRVGFAEIINTKLMNAHNGQQHQKRNRLRSAEILISSSQQLVSNLITSVQLAGFTNVLNVKNGVVKLFVIRNSECSP